MWGQIRDLQTMEDDIDMMEDVLDMMEDDLDRMEEFVHSSSLYEGSLN